MRRLSTLSLFLVTACVLTWPRGARASGVAEFYSVLDYDAGWGTMNGYAETHLDYMTLYYYNTCTTSYLGYDSTTVDWGSQCVEQASSSVSTYSDQLVAGKDYSLLSYHTLEAAFVYDELYVPCYMYCSSYDDRFGFSWMSEGTSSWETEHWFYSNNPETPLSTQAAKSGYTYTPIIHVGVCGDQDKDLLIGEYMNPQYGAPTVPQCSELTNSSQSSHFSFTQLNTGDYPWAILTSGLTSGTDCVWDHKGTWSLDVNSAYRNPLRNQTLGGVAGSNHIYGQAVDFNSTSQDHWNAISDAGKNYCSACREPSTVNWVHLDWRGACPAQW